MTKTRKDKWVEPSSSFLTFKIKAKILETSSSPLEAIRSSLMFKIEVEILKTDNSTRSRSIIFEVQGQGRSFEFSIKPKKLFKMDRFQGIKSSSLLKTLVNNLTSMEFIRDRSFIQDIIQTSQSHLTTLARWFKFYKKAFRFRTNVFVSRVRKVKFNELTWRIRILPVKFSRDHYYLELKTEDRVLDKRNKTT